MNCPRCGSNKRQAVKDTRSEANGRINRRRRCPDCGHDFVTVEQLAETRMYVKKSDGRVVAFSREAVRRSMVEAAVRKYDPDQISELIDSVIAEVYPKAEDGVVPSATIAESVLSHFREIEEVSQIRFALVHMGRQDRSNGRPGWADIRDVRQWLGDEYPGLHYAPVPSRLAEVCKRDRQHEPFDARKIETGVRIASKGRGSPEEVERMAKEVAAEVERALGDQPLVTSGQISAEILRILRHWDHVAYLRYASTAKRFRTPIDYEAEAAALEHAETRRTPRASARPSRRR